MGLPLPLHKKGWPESPVSSRIQGLEDQHFSELSLGQSQRRKQAFSEVAYTPEAVGCKYEYFVSARHSHCRGQGFDSPMLHTRNPLKLLRFNGFSFILLDDNFGPNRPRCGRSIRNPS